MLEVSEVDKSTISSKDKVNQMVDRLYYKAQRDRKIKEEIRTRIK